MAELSTGQRKAIEAIVGDDRKYAVTYKEVIRDFRGVSSFSGVRHTSYLKNFICKYYPLLLSVDYILNFPLPSDVVL